MRELEVELKDLWDNIPTMSRIEFVQAFHQKADTAVSIFAKQDLVIIPSVTRLFGGDESDRMAYYLELYPAGSDTDKVVIETRIRKLYGSMVYRDTLHVTIEGAPVRQLREVSLQQFTPGEYDMEVSLQGRRGKNLSSATYRFEVLWTQEGMIRNDWTNTIRQLSLIAEGGELDRWDRLKTFEERQQAFRQFWIDRDPTIGTPANEVMLEFYHRVSVANHSFGMPRREGWRTDRGRIFIQFGQPDQVDDEPFAPNTYPYQIWHYYSEGRYRRFLFIDEREDGDYRLQYPFDGLNQRPDF
jgi:GWxTD domain-containing protein